MTGLPGRGALILPFQQVGPSRGVIETRAARSLERARVPGDLR